MSTTADYMDVGDHSLSPPQNVIQNDILAIQSPHEHYPDHVHHDEHTEKGRKDEIAVPDGTTFEKSSIMPQDLPHHDLHRRQHAVMVKEPVAAINPEQGTVCPSHSSEDPQTHSVSMYYTRYRIFFHLFLGVLFTGWWIVGLVLHGIHEPLSSNTGWLKPFLLWLVIALKIFFSHVPISVLTKPMSWVWRATGVRFAELLPDRFKTPLAALLVVSVFLIGGFVSPESEDNTRNNRAVCTYIRNLHVLRVFALESCFDSYYTP